MKKIFATFFGKIKKVTRILAFSYDTTLFLFSHFGACVFYRLGGGEAPRTKNMYLNSIRHCHQYLDLWQSAYNNIKLWSLCEWWKV